MDPVAATTERCRYKFLLKEARSGEFLIVFAPLGSHPAPLTTHHGVSFGLRGDATRELAQQIADSLQQNVESFAITTVDGFREP